ncbi:hypothetical protein ACFX2J_016475 [Malus domestica]
MAQWACVSAANLSCQATIVHTQKQRNSPGCDAFSFRGSEFMAQSCKLSSPQAVYRRPRNGVCPLKVVCVDYPRPDLDSTAIWQGGWSWLTPSPSPKFGAKKKKRAPFLGGG